VIANINNLALGLFRQTGILKVVEAGRFLLHIFPLPFPAGSPFFLTLLQPWAVHGGERSENW